ncbi:MAG: HNH endonuclease family protein [Pseudoclavibacter sp.]|nr:HNH endonuclease family protein [Pseudoclavibacter sp.]
MSAIRRRSAPLAVLAAAALIALSGCRAAPADTGAPATLVQELAEQGPGASPEASTARLAEQVLEGLPVRPRTEWDGPFDRKAAFGEGWTDPDGNGCDARNDALQEAMADERLLGDGCRVDRGTFTDPYSGQTVPFQRGPQSSERVQIDHVVALYNAWRTGARDWSFEQRQAFANDPINLQATLDWVNDEKKAQDASRWLPPDESYRCTYVARQIAIKASYGLWVTRAEHDAMREVLDGCA